MPDTGPARPGRIARFEAPVAWRRIDFISDLHLHEAAPATWSAFCAHLRATPADAVFMLGDLFDAWVGDDAADEAGFAQDAAACLAEAAGRLTLAFMPGNRDFLLGTGGLLARCGVRLLDDPCTLHAFGARWLLSHGDLACVADLPYQRFRAEVHAPAWQAAFLAQGLDERRAFAARARAASVAAQSAMPTELWADVDTGVADTMLAQAQSEVMIHGHTHRPAVHAQRGGHAQRWVLSDWDLDGTHATAPRAEVLSLSAQGLVRCAPST